MRISLGIEYNGNHYMGWQIQPDKPTVQGELEKAISLVAGTPIEQMQVAGRTDRGVHATGQVAHFDTDIYRSEKAWVNGTNRYLRERHISVLWTKCVPDDFHARFGALRRRYRYILLNRSIRPSILTQLVSWENRELFLQPMQKAAQYLLGEHNFNAYRTVHCQSKTPVKIIYQLNVNQHGQYFYFDVEANAFLHHMVRNIVGVLLAIGRGEQLPVWAKEVLDSQDRTQGGITAPADGLYLNKVTYDKVFELPEMSHDFPSFVV